MPTLTPKQAEIRSREAKILDLARPMVAHSGLNGLSMEAIAKQMALAKGTIYNHFACKEEILLALAIKANQKRQELFRAAAQSQTRTRLMIAAIGVACEDFRVRFADWFLIDAMVRHVTVWDKASEKRREMLANMERDCMSLVSQIGAEAVRCGDLVLPEGRGVEDIMFGLWSLTYGGMVLDDTSPGLDQIGIRNSYAAIRRNCHALMDGYAWQPLYDPQRDHALVDQVGETLRHAVPGSDSVGEMQKGGVQTLARSN